SSSIFAWIEIQTLRAFQPERRSGFGIEMPLDDLPHMRVQLFPGGFHLHLHVGGCDCAHSFSAFWIDFGFGSALRAVANWFLPAGTRSLPLATLMFVDYTLKRRFARSGFERERIEISVAVIIILLLNLLKKIDYPISERRSNYLHQDFRGVVEKCDLDDSLSRPTFSAEKGQWVKKH